MNKECQLFCIVFDEVHCIFTDVGYQSAFKKLQWIEHLGTPLVLMSGTLPKVMTPKIRQGLGLDLHPFQELQALCVNPNIQKLVQVVSHEQQLATLQQLVNVAIP
ncbi:hypothetical protein GX51_08325 [Blastomyces parvus]|uniref:Helicase ATP-binding domain-containing protein n=1 Tax=Blastomyces parvus TaxID=2060905 RepID=A0A2B7WEI7_9EURO|nr:hypothetical protein GX51_08325 [Blastomyces parvus]